jgi:uncharacterized membrane protein (UPF0127 family)
MIVEISKLNVQESTKIRATYCSSFFCKFKGLMLRKSLQPQEGILLVEEKDSILSTSIHMFFMRFDIAAIWIDSQNTIVDIKLAKKWRPYYASQSPAKYVLECHVSQLSNFKIGDSLVIKNV